MKIKICYKEQMIKDGPNGYIIKYTLIHPEVIKIENNFYIFLNRSFQVSKR